MHASRDPAYMPAVEPSGIGTRVGKELDAVLSRIVPYMVAMLALGIAGCDGGDPVTHVRMGLDFIYPEGDQAIMGLYYVPYGNASQSVVVLLDDSELVSFEYHATREERQRVSSRQVLVGFFPIPAGVHTTSATSSSGRPARFSDSDWRDDLDAEPEPPSTVRGLPGQILWIAVIEWKDEIQVLASRRQFSFY